MEIFLIFNMELPEKAQFQQWGPVFQMKHITYVSEQKKGIVSYVSEKNANATSCFTIL